MCTQPRYVTLQSAVFVPGATAALYCDQLVLELAWLPNTCCCVVCVLCDELLQLWKPGAMASGCICLYSLEQTQKTCTMICLKCVCFMYYRDKLIIKEHGKHNTVNLMFLVYFRQVSVLCTLISVVNFLEVSVILRGFHIWLYLYIFCFAGSVNQNQKQCKKSSVVSVLFSSHVVCSL